MKRTLLLILALALLAPCAAHAHTREEVREAYGALETRWEGSPYLQPPAVRAPYAEGSLDGAAAADALAYLNFARWLAGVDPVTESAIYDYQCRHGAVLLAALDYVDHDAPNPGDMEKNFYDSAHIATASSNIARFNWMRDTILREGVEYFLRDDGEENLAALGHRRWALNPTMAATGFGLANSESGMSYVVMYAHDLGNPDVAWDSVCWPAAGAFPAELIHDHLAWSVMLNPALYDSAASHPVVTLRELASGLSFRFDCQRGAGDGFCAFNREGYGAGPCLIFRPDFSGLDFTDYQQNQVWAVRAEGLVGADGQEKALEYRVEMISLAVQDVVNVEISQLEASLRAGDALALSADVIPAYADDLTLSWRSTDEAVATVDGAGRVTALSPGVCEIVVEAGGFEDRCRVTVEQKPSR